MSKGFKFGTGYRIGSLCSPSIILSKICRDGEPENFVVLAETWLFSDLSILWCEAKQKKQSRFIYDYNILKDHSHTRDATLSLDRNCTSVCVCVLPVVPPSSSLSLLRLTLSPTDEGSVSGLLSGQ